MSQQISQETFILVCKRGTYYNPAKKHYEDKSNNVICDRCCKHNLNVCIGYEKYDLCLNCTEEVIKINEQNSKFKIRSITNPTPDNSLPPMDSVKSRMLTSQFHNLSMTFMQQSQFDHLPKSYMQQSQFDYLPKSYMRQSQFDK